MSERGLQRGPCRCCLSTGTLSSMEHGHAQTYSDMLRDTFGLTLARVPGAQLICGVCEIRLRDALAFRTQVVDSERALFEHIPFQDVEMQIKCKDPAACVKDELLDTGVHDNAGDLDDDLPLNMITLSKCELQERAESPLTEPTATEQLEDDSWGEATLTESRASTDANCDTSARKKRAVRYFCVFCKKIFKLKKSLVHHTAGCESTNNSVLPSNCSLCPTTFAGNAAIISDHMLREHQCETKYSIYGRTVDCDMCDKKFPNILKKINHLRGTHHRCKRCSRVFRNTYERDEHAMAAHPFQCTLCAESFATRSVQIQHTWDVHGTKCNLCNEKFHTKYAMRRHNVEAHRAEVYNCGACGNTYQCEAKLKLHQRNFHLLERNVSCPQCDYKGFNNCNLKKHMISHSKDKQFQCKYCNKTFARPSNLMFHERIHTGDKRQVCKLCGQAFVQRASLKYHLEKYHPGDV